MQRQDFHFQLPEALIAQYPLAKRTDSRMLVFDSQQDAYQHQNFSDLPAFLRPGDVLVLNDTKVIPARLYGRKDTGGQVELLIERITGDRAFIAHIKASKAPRPGTHIIIDERWQVCVSGRQNDLFMCTCDDNVMEMLDACGHIPLPPYIERQDDQKDVDRYQTVYARYQGSVAAPTAGLHFDDAMLAVLKAKGIHLAYTTLHVGAGTFQPVRVDDIAQHKMHCESYQITRETVETIQRAKQQGGRVIAVGTTSMRTLESGTVSGRLTAKSGETDIFITPGYEFQVCDGLITNFHLPESTLLMLVSAFIGHQQTMALYKEAIRCQYRFFSYGDTSLLWRNPND